MEKEIKCIGFADYNGDAYLYNTWDNKFDNCANENGINFDKYKDASLLDAQICMTLNDIDKVSRLSEIIFKV